ncbi:hypothetical protein P0L94_03570 [Microbacter sp. GSS18]|nr:hypothetical protein P0L94_03570 [Microbacter sp. GSS18]
MYATTVHPRGAARLRLASLAATLLLLTGCTAEASSPDPEITTWQEAFDEAWGEDWENLTEIDGVAEDFPAEIPLPEGELVHSMAGPGVWDMIFETDQSEEQAQQLLEALGRIAGPAEEQPPDPEAQGGSLWTFFDDSYAIIVQMQPGPWPPPMVAIGVVQR